MSEQNLSFIVSNFLLTESPAIPDERIIRVFCDVDGVLADFRQGIQRAYKLPNDAAVKKFLDSPNAWSEIAAKTPNIFAQLPVMSNAQQLITGLIRYRDRGYIKLAMLTALPDEWYADSYMRELGRNDKKNWVHKNFPQISADNVIVVRREDKVQFAIKQKRMGHPAPVLIDDYDLNISEWHKKGDGIGILYKSSASATAALSQLNQYIVATLGDY